MLFIHLSLNAHTVLVVLIFAILYLTASSFLGFSILVDITTRLNPNDSYISMYYFWWTNLTYLPTFFFLVFSLLIWHSVRKLSSSGLILVCLFLSIHATELADYLALNSTEVGVIYGTYGLNPLLSNIMNRYHPLMFYISVSIFALTVFYVLVINSSRRFYFLPQKSLNNAQTYGWTAILLNLIALWMGSWWALQEGTWGGWWNWDPSETFGLLVTLGLLTTLHSSLRLSVIPRLVNKALFNLLLFLITYFFIQLNFDLVSHNFGSKFFFFFNNNLFFLEMSQLILSTFVFLACSSYSNRFLSTYKVTTHAPNLKSKQALAVGLIAPLLVTLLVVWSLRPLLNYFLWNFFDLNIGNWEPSLKPILLLLGISFYVWVQKTTKTENLVLLPIFIMTHSWLPALLLVTESKSWIVTIHTMITLFIFIDLLTYGLSPIEWITESYNIYNIFNSSIQLLSSQSFVLDSNAHELSHIITTLNGTLISDWNLVTFANAPANNFFLLNSQLTDYRNFYYLGNLYSCTYLNLELPLLGALNFIFLIAIIIARHKFKHNNLELRI